MAIKIKEIPTLINNEENRIRKIGKFLKEHPDEAFLEEEIMKETGIECVHSLLHQFKYERLISQEHIRSVDIIRKGEFSCGSDDHWYYSPPKPKKKSFWSRFHKGERQ